MNSNMVLPLVAVLLPGIGQGNAEASFTVDDSYTVSQRYILNKERFPELQWPELRFETGQRVQFDRRYKLVGERELHIDLFLPPRSVANEQAIMLVHGGGWRSGNKSHLYPLANLLAQRGYSVFLPEYRLSAEAQYPAGLLDLNDAMVWVKDRASEYGFRPDRLAIGGASSGGQMAALLAYTANRSWFKTSAGDDTRASALIDLDGVLDFTTPLAIEHENRKGDESAAGLWFGGAMEKTLEKWQQASAARHVHPQAPPTLIISSGQARFTAGKDSVIQKLDEFGIRNKYVEYGEILHTFWLFDPYVSEVAATIDRFLDPPDDAELVYRVQQDCPDAGQCYETIQAALDDLQATRRTGWGRVEIGAGSYNEKVVVRSDKVSLVGDGAMSTRLYFDAVAQDAGKYHRDNWGTPGSATLTIDADQVTVEGLTIENTFDYLANDALPDEDADKIVHSQGLALLLDIHSDRVHLDGVSLVAYQDTLFANGERAYVTNSFISGNVDFIFGNGQLLIEDSTIESRRRGKSFEPGEIQSFITAPSTQLADDIGIVIHRSRLTRESGVPDRSVTLGRPWHPTTDFPDGRYADPNAVGQALFIDCFMDAHIHEQHWSSMHGTARDGTKTDVFHPQDSRFHETGSYGPGAEHLDIGILWSGAPTIDEVYESMFADWPAMAERLSGKEH